MISQKKRVSCDRLKKVTHSPEIRKKIAARAAAWALSLLKGGNDHTRGLLNHAFIRKYEKKYVKINFLENIFFSKLFF